jgi:murein DD-endopeptidase MepM/ murein hydrolase activator NlpD
MPTMPYRPARHCLLLLVGLLLPSLGSALPMSSQVPGGVVLVPLEARDAQAPQVFFRDRRVLVVGEGSEHTAVVGVPLNVEPGPQNLEIRWASGARSAHAFDIGGKEYAVQRLTIPDHRKVEPSAKDYERIAAERKTVRRLLRTWSEAEPDLEFIVPVEGRRSSSFGLRRILNGLPRSPHRGMDIAAPTGTPIRAPAPGVVMHVGDFFFSGKVVYVDHGSGLITLYAHLDEASVDAGTKLERGEVLGTVGATGRVTGAHLHWSIYLNGTAVDPALFIDDTPVAQAGP